MKRWLKLAWKAFKALRYVVRVGVKASEVHLATQMVARYRNGVVLGLPRSQDGDYNRWLQQHYPSATSLAYNQEAQACFARTPMLSVIMPVFNAEPEHLREAIASVQAQIYPYWELCIADDASTREDTHQALRELAAQDGRIQLVFRKENGHIAQASNSALELASGEFTLLMDQDDLLTADALFEVALALNQHPQMEMFYSDEDHQEGRQLMGAYFKPAWSPDLFLGQMYCCHLNGFKTDRLRSIGGFDPAMNGAQDYDLILRFSEGIEPNQILHIPSLLYHWRIHEGSAAGSQEAKPWAYDAAQRALTAANLRRGEPGQVVEIPGFRGQFRTYYELKGKPQVSVILAVTEVEGVAQRIKALWSEEALPLADLWICGESSLLAALQAQLGALDRLHWLASEASWAAQWNQAAQKAQGEYFLFLDSAAQTPEGDWAGELLRQAQRRAVGAVGPMFIEAKGRVHNAGLVLGMAGLVGRSHHGSAMEDPGYRGRLLIASNYAALSGAALLCRREVFEQVGRFEAEQGVYFDADFCLRVLEAGYQNVNLPWVRFDLGQASPLGAAGAEGTKEEQAAFSERWANYLAQDPYYSPHLSRAKEGFNIRLEPIAPDQYAAFASRAGGSLGRT